MNFRLYPQVFADKGLAAADETAENVAAGVQSRYP
jgi:hypothetical protein